MDSATARIIERFGLFFEREGLPRIAGRIIGYLLLSEAPRSLDDIADALGVSKASVSTDARRLETKGLVERSSLPGDRRDFYAIAPDGFRTTLQARIDALHRFSPLLTEAEQLPGTSRTIRERIAEWHAFHQAMIDSMTDLLSHWEEQMRTPSRGRQQ